MKLEIRSSVRTLLSILIISNALLRFDLLGAPVDPIGDDNWAAAKQAQKTWNLGSYRTAQTLFSNLARSRAAIKDKESASAAYRESARLLAAMNEYGPALAELRSAIDLDDGTGNIESKIESLSVYALTLLQDGKTPETELACAAIRELLPKAVTASARANAFYALGEYNYYHGDGDQTIDLFRNALLESENANDRTLTVMASLHLAFGQIRQGDPVSALTNINRSLSLTDELNDDRLRAIVKVGLGFAYSVMDSKQEALNAYRSAELLFPEDMDWLEKARLSNGIATVYGDYGDFAQSLSYRRKALELYKRAGYLSGQLATLPSLATMLFISGDRASAEQMLDEASQLAKNLNEEFYFGIIEEFRAKIDLESGDYGSAVKSFLRAAALYKKLKLNLPRIENDLGLAYEKAGSMEDARIHYSTALDANLKAQDLIPAAENLYNLARLHRSFGEDELALQQISKSVSMTDYLSKNVGNSGLGTRYFSRSIDRFQLFISLLMKKHDRGLQDDFAMQALLAAERSRGRSMLERLVLSEANFFADADPMSVQKEKEVRISLNAKSDILTDLLGRDGDKDQIIKVSGEINELQNRLEEIKADLKQKSPVYSAIKDPPPFDVADFQENVLDDRSVLLEFSLGNDESYLWVVAKNGLDAYVLPPRAQIEGRIESLRSLLAARQITSGETIDEHQKRIAEAEQKYWPEARELSKMVLGQAADKIKNKRLIVVPDGKLHYFPLSALPLPDSENDEPLVQTNEVIYQPSAQTLALLTKTHNKPLAQRRDLLIFSDPVFTTSDSRLSGNGEQTANTEVTRSDSFRFVESLSSLARLPGSGTEAASITDIVGGSTIDAFSGFAATREQLLNAKLADYKILHFATHGVINNERPELSGIVMSRYNKNGHQIDEFIRLADIYAMHLNADLVVLSACETGTGKEVRGEGIMGLNSAFLQAGASTVLASLWKVEDGASQILMKEFYTGISSGGLTPSESLRRAQMKLAADPRYRSPFYWAAFTLQGDMNVRPAISHGLSVWIYLFLAVPVGLFGIYLFRRKKQITKK